MKGNSAAGRLFGLKSLICFLAVVLAGNLACFGQKYTFSHYDIADGLIQSQANAIVQDPTHGLWIGTYGGASYFNGKEFTSYTRANGLPNDFVYTLFTDRAGVTWFGTENGIANIKRGKIFVFKSPANLNRTAVTQITQDRAGTVWFLMANRLFRINEQKIVAAPIQVLAKAPVACLAIDKQGALYAWVYTKGLYKLNGDNWVQLISNTDLTFIIRSIIFESGTGNFYLMSDKNVYYFRQNVMQLFRNDLISQINSRLLTIEQDATGNLWVGANSGAYCIKNGKLIHFGVNNGFTDKAVSAIYCDGDKNLWFATQGNGFYKYEGDTFVTYDKSQGLTDDHIIFGIAKDNTGAIILGLNGGGLIRFKDNKFTTVPPPTDKPGLKQVQCLYTDKKGVLWIGTELGGLWKSDKGVYTLIKGTDRLSVNGIIEDADGTIWVATPAGCFCVDNNNKFTRVAGSHAFAFATLPIAKDSVLIGTHDGLALAVNKTIVQDFKLDAVKKLAVICMITHGDNLVMGTDDNGVYTWNRTTGKVQNFNTATGLNSNAVYSLATDEKGVIWLGTGHQADRLIFDKGQSKFKISNSKSAKEPIFESAQNGMFYDNQDIYMATDGGLVVYNTNTPEPVVSGPNTIIQSVKLIPVSTNSSTPKPILLTNGATLAYNENHLDISFIGVYLRDPASVLYRYKLSSLDSTFSAPVKNNMLDYPALPPGQYIFQVKSFTADEPERANTASFSFTITPPFYQTWLFRITGVLFLIILGVLIQAYRHSLKTKRIVAIENIRREENIKVRQEAAEDFHDDLGNKLTRISVLTDMLFTKIDAEKTDQKKLLEQIKQNALSLYTGTRDILWAMDTQSDNLFEVINYIREFGVDLFIDTPIKFEFIGLEQSLSQVKLPIKFNRNIILIFKELLNNALKHAGASQVIMDLVLQNKNELTITITDDGKGFDTDAGRKGQGINNIINRAKRIGGVVAIKSAPGAGTVITLNFKLNTI